MEYIVPYSGHDSPQSLKTLMPKERIEGRIEEVKGKVVGNQSPEQTGSTQKNAGKNHAVTGDDPTSTKSTTAPKAQGAITLLHRDHKIVSDRFDEYEKISVKSRKNSLVVLICADLTIHAQVEEEIFYPALNEILKDKRLAPRAISEHATLKDLIADVKGLKRDGDHFDARIKLLSEYVKHHVKEQQDAMFPRAAATKLDMMEIGAQMASRKEELVAERSRQA